MLLSEQSKAITVGEKRRERKREMGEKTAVGRKVGSCNFKESRNTAQCSLSWSLPRLNASNQVTLQRPFGMTSSLSEKNDS